MIFHSIRDTLNAYSCLSNKNPTNVSLSLVDSISQLGNAPGLTSKSDFNKSDQ